MIKKLYDNRWALYSLPKSIWFNFKYLPFKQAIKLPILFYNPLFLECKGKVIIDSDDVHFGMIKLGLSVVSFYPKAGITFENHGGVLTIGNESGCSASLKLACYHCIDIEDGVRFGWNCSIIDTDFHRLKLDVDSPFTLQKPYAPIVIG